jgi:disulfide bond formation protein DsbB
MSNVRFKLMAGLAGATLCLFAVSAYGQNTNAQTTPPASAGTAGSVDQQQAVPTTQGTQPTTTGTATTPTTTSDGSITSTATDVTTTTRSFPMWGIIAAVVVVLVILVALFRGRDRTVVRETYASSSTSSPSNRTAGTATASDDRARAASGTGTTSGTNDPNAGR